MIQNFSIFKVDNKKQDKDPDYRISVKLGDEYVEAGAGWIKTSPKGTKYISCRLSKPYKNRKGFVLASTDMEEALPVIDRNEQDEVVNMQF